MSKSITAHRDGQTKTFSKEVWEALPHDKYGWKVKAEKPPEVAELEEKESAADVIEKIGRMRSVEKIDELINGETRVTVLKAADERKAQLGDKSE